MKKIFYIIILVSTTLYSSKIQITEKGVIDLHTNKIVNKYINTIPTSYTFYIENKKNKFYGISKEVRLSSSQAQCYAPLKENKNNYRVYNVYCFDREIKGKKIQPIFYIYNMQGASFKTFTFDAPENIQISFGHKNNKKILFTDINITMVKNKKSIQSNIQCIVPGKDFFNSDFEHFKCSIKSLKKMLEAFKKNKKIDLLQYKDMSLLQNTSYINPLTPKTLTQYNNIAYYLQKAGANKEAVYLLEKIIKKFPNRTVAYYNLGDAYWELGEKNKAIKAYTTYIEQMCHKGLQKKIPKQVLQRVERKHVCK